MVQLFSVSRRLLQIPRPKDRNQRNTSIIQIKCKQNTNKTVESFIWDQWSSISVLVTSNQTRKKTLQEIIAINHWYHRQSGSYFAFLIDFFFFTNRSNGFTIPSWVARTGSRNNVKESFKLENNWSKKKKILWLGSHFQSNEIWQWNLESFQQVLSRFSQLHLQKVPRLHWN